MSILDFRYIIFAASLIWISGEADLHKLFENFQVNERLTVLFSYLCVVGMMACTASVAVLLLQRVVPDWRMGYLPWLAGLLALEAINSHHLLRRTALMKTNSLAYRFVEVVIVLTLLKVFSLLWKESINLQAEMQAWNDNFLMAFFSPDFLISLLILAITWLLSVLYLEDIASLEGDKLLLHTETSEGLTSNRAATGQQIANRMITVGGALVFITVLTRLDYLSFHGALPSTARSITSLLVYFLFGLILVSLSQLARYRAIWAWERVPVATGLAQRWLVFSIIFLIILGVIALILPAGYVVGFIPALGYIFGGLFSLVFALILLVIVPFLYLISQLFRFIGLRPITQSQPLNIQQLLPNAGSNLPSDSSAWLDLVKSILFWVIIIGLIGCAIFAYIKQNEELVTKLRRLPGMSWLIKAWRWVVVRLQEGAKSIPITVQAGIQRMGAIFARRKNNKPFRFINVRRLDARQQVLFYYYAVVRRFSEVGLPRLPWQTPEEYMCRLSPEYKDFSNEISRITQAFIEARYSRHDVSANQVDEVRSAWQMIRSSIKRTIRRQGNG